MSSAEDEVLQVNRAFYAAFSRGDLKGLDALWAREAGVACIHPGWPPVEGRAGVMQSWQQIFDAGGPQIVCDRERAFVHGDAAFVICVEHLANGDLVATNYFVREDGVWRLAHHQAGPLPALPAADPDDTVH